MWNQYLMIWYFLKRWSSKITIHDHLLSWANGATFSPMEAIYLQVFSYQIFK